MRLRALARLQASPSAVDLARLAELAVVIVATWLALGHAPTTAFGQADATVQWIPYTRSALEAGADWTHHLYRFGVLGGSAMHDAAGTTPLVQLCALLGLSATATANLAVVVLQVCFAFFGLSAIEALAGRALAAPERIAAAWACAFAPVLGWRFGYGHDNLVLGLVPFAAAFGLLAMARRKMPSATALAAGVFAACEGASALGEQMVVYAAVFAAPLLAWLVADAARGERWTRRHAIVAVALVAGVLIALPRLCGMIAHVTGDDFSRAGGHLTYSYGAARWHDWLTSIPWTTAATDAWPSALPIHERNLPLGPLAVLALAGSPRWLRRAMIASALLAIGFACDVPGVAAALIAVIPPLGWFRVPGRAIVPLLAVLPAIALGAAFGGGEPAGRIPWLGVLAGAAAIALGRGHDLIADVVAWGGCISLVVARPRGEVTAAAVAAIAALGVVAFDARVPRDPAADPIEHGPAELRAAVLAQAPEVAMPLARVQIVDPPRPYDMSTAFAAGLPAIDGAWYPTRRFLLLLSGVLGKPIDPTTGVFALSHSAAFPILQQLYDVRYAISLRDGAVTALPEPPGAAWFPATLATGDGAADLVAHRAELRAELLRVGWVDGPPPAPATCAGATVDHVATDRLGQVATIDVRAPADCALIVSTNYVSTLTATATVGGQDRVAPVFPIDVALTGIAVPRGATRIVLAPQPVLPWWSRAAPIAGVLLLGATLWARRR